MSDNSIMPMESFCTFVRVPLALPRMVSKSTTGVEDTVFCMAPGDEGISAAGFCGGFVLAYKYNAATNATPTMTNTICWIRKRELFFCGNAVLDLIHKCF